MYPRPLLRLLAASVVVGLAASPLPAAASGLGEVDAPTSQRLIGPVAAKDRVQKGQLAAHWQGRQLTRGRINSVSFGVTDWGLTIETAFALAADGTQPKRLARVARAIENNYYAHYATFGRTTYAGAMTKVLVVAEVLGERPRDFGGRNVRDRVLALMAPAGAGSEAGRFRNSRGSDTSNTFSQALGVLGLARSGAVPQPAVNYLTRQQCARGFFRIFPTVGSNCTRSGSAADVDATALAVQALLAARAAGARIPHDAISRASAWLARVQKRNGSFGGGAATAAPNGNSTGLAAQALKATHRGGAARAAARYVSSLQITARRAGAGPARRDVGAIGYDPAALRGALKRGIRPGTRDQFRRTTPQALAALIPKPLNTLTAP